MTPLIKSAGRILAPVMIIIAGACSPEIAAAETHTVQIQNFEFSPAEIDVSVGDTIVWVNLDVAPHTATANDDSWDSGAMGQGDEWSLVVEAAGSIDYICTFHPNMTGVINAR